MAPARWGCARYIYDLRMPRHLVDAERSGLLGYPIAHCGTELYYLDNEMIVRLGDPCSGKQVVSERTRECRKCLRREAERTDTIMVPVTALASLARAAPIGWAEVSTSLSSRVVTTVNSLL